MRGESFAVPEGSRVTIRFYGGLGELTLRSGGVVDADLVDPEQPRCRFRRHRDRRGRFVARR